jgi:hypothetical protein
MSYPPGLPSCSISCARRSTEHRVGVTVAEELRASGKVPSNGRSLAAVALTCSIVRPWASTKETVGSEIAVQFLTGDRQGGRDLHGGTAPRHPGISQKNAVDNKRDKVGGPHHDAAWLCLCGSLPPLSGPGLRRRAATLVRNRCRARHTLPRPAREASRSGFDRRA